MGEIIKEHDGNWYHVERTEKLPFKLTRIECLGYLPYGSRVYNTNTCFSDFDGINIIDGEEISVETCHTHVVEVLGERSKLQEEQERFVSLDVFQKQLDDHDMVAMEAYFNGILTNKIGPALNNLSFNLDLAKLRCTISGVSSNSWVKAKKKLEIEALKYKTGDPMHSDMVYIGKKSLFHCLRIIRFGIQIATYGSIEDFKECVPLFHEIMDNPAKDWGTYKQLYQGLKNKWLTEFRILAPKSC